MLGLGKREGFGTDVWRKRERSVNGCRGQWSLEGVGVAMSVRWEFEEVVTKKKGGRCG